MLAAAVYFACALSTCPNASDTNPGTRGAPFLTIQRCVDAAKSGTCYVRAGTYQILTNTDAACAGNTYGLFITSNGATLSYYPSDGIASAKIRSGAQIGICILTATGVSVVGLDIAGTPNAGYSGIRLIGFTPSQSAANATFQWNFIHDLAGCVSRFGAGIELIGGYYPGTAVISNLIQNVCSAGIESLSSVIGGQDNLAIASNEIVAPCTMLGDCGAIYLWTGISGCPSNTISVDDNFINGSDVGLYADDGVCDVAWTSNVVGNVHARCAQIHGGNNNVFESNVCDLTGAMYSVEQNIPKMIMLFQQSGGAPDWMQGDSWTNNVVVCKTTFPLCGQGYTYDAAPGSLLTTNNAYYNYGSGHSVNTTGNQGNNNDTNPVYENPQIHCWNAKIASSSPVYNYPVNFAPIPGNWGVPGVPVNTRLLAPPSWSPAC